MQVHDLPAATTAKITACNPEVLATEIDNLIKLNDLNEQAILYVNAQNKHLAAARRAAACVFARAG
jgi:hypothetical protein